MKTSIVLTLVTIFMISITSFELHHSDTDAKEKIGVQVISALQRSSAYEFSALFPTLSDFHYLMLRNAELYGQNLTEAAREFEKEFEQVLLPEFKYSFERIVDEGTKAGIDWRTVQLVSVEVPDAAEADFSVVPMTITFTSGATEHRLVIEKALLIKGEWKISQFISLQ